MLNNPNKILLAPTLAALVPPRRVMLRVKSMLSFDAAGLVDDRSTLLLSKLYATS